MTHSQEYAACLVGGEDHRSQIDRDYQEIPRITNKRDFVDAVDAYLMVVNSRRSLKM